MSDDSDIIPEVPEARPEPAGAPWELMGRAERIAAGASLGWAVIAGLAMALGGQSLVGPVLVVVVPVALIWIGCSRATPRAARARNRTASGPRSRPCSAACARRRGVAACQPNSIAASRGSNAPRGRPRRRWRGSA